MQLLPRFFSSRLSAAESRVYRCVTAYFLLVSAAMLWPVYPLFSRVRPLVLGMPFSLFYLAALLVLSFGVAVALYLWEGRRGVMDGASEPEAGSRTSARGESAG